MAGPSQPVPVRPVLQPMRVLQQVPVLHPAQLSHRAHWPQLVRRPARQQPLVAPGRRVPILARRRTRRPALQAHWPGVAAAAKRPPRARSPA